MSWSAGIRMTPADRLREVALGREGVQLLDWLGARPIMPRSDPISGSLELKVVSGGVYLDVPALRESGRIAVAVRITDSRGEPLRTTSPFHDNQGHFLWCGVPSNNTLFLPLTGLERCSEARIETHLLQIGRGPATPLAHANTPLGAVGDDPWNALDWAEPLVILAVAMVHADGIVRASERLALQNLLQLTGVNTEELDRVLDRPTPADLAPHVARLRIRMPALGPRTLLERLGVLAVASGCPGMGERAVLREIADCLNVPDSAFRRLLQGWQVPRGGPPSDLHQAYRVLGLEPGRPRAEVKRRWRDLLRQHHPDLQVGKTDVELDRATEYTVQLNTAFRLIDERGLTGRPAPARQVEPELSERTPGTPTVAAPSNLLQRVRALSNLQVAGGSLAVALLAFAVGLALNGHVAVAVAAVEHALR
ncbi:MAG: DnaJ like chaperone protein [Kiritimatiellia bacterium]|jgi:DnaJ like chaperone protein